MSLQILHRQPTQTLSQRPLCLKELLRRIREREHRARENRAYWRRFFGLDGKIPPGNETHALLSIGLKSDEELHPDFEESINLSNAIIASGFLVFCVGIIVCAIMLACTAYIKRPAPRTYVVQSGFLEIRP